MTSVPVNRTGVLSATREKGFEIGGPATPVFGRPRTVTLLEVLRVMRGG